MLTSLLAAAVLRRAPTPHRRALVRALASAAPADVRTAALLACKKKGKWRQALHLLDEIDGAPGGAPREAFHAALAACRQRERKTEALALLERMGSSADTVALNELLHLARVRRDFDLALAMWDRLAGAPSAAVLGGSAPAPSAASVPAPAVGPTADGRSYLQLLQLCGLTGRWAAAVALLDGMRARGLETEPAHWVAVLRACARDRRFDEARRVAEQVPRAWLAQEGELSARALEAAAEAGAPKLAMEVLAHRAEAEGRDADAVTADHALALQACRRAADLDVGREAWASLLREASPVTDELCFAQMVGLLFDRCRRAPAAADHAAELAEAMTLARQAAAAMPAHRAAVVLAAALAGTIDADEPAAACEALRLLHAAGADEAAETEEEEEAVAVTGAAQLRVLRMCADGEEWALVAAEAAAAAARRLSSWEEIHLDEIAALRRRAADAADAAEAAEAAAALQALEEETRALVDAQRAEEAAAAAGATATKRRRPPSTAARRYSRTIPLSSEDVPLEIVFEDDELLAVSKPSGVSSVPRHRFEGGAMVNRVAHHIGRSPYVLHRLDMPTSGLLLFAKSLPAAQALSTQFRDRLVSKEYVAVVRGVPADAAFSVDAPIAPHPTDTTLSVAAGGGGAADEWLRARGKPALTHFRVLGAVSGGGAALCSCRPVSGRMHQIRVHAELAGHPLLGDTQYGPHAGAPGLLAPGEGRLLLHARSLRLRHPSRREGVEFSAGLPDDFLEGARRAGLLASAERVAGRDAVEWLGE